MTRSVLLLFFALGLLCLGFSQTLDSDLGWHLTSGGSFFARGSSAFSPDAGSKSPTVFRDVREVL